MQIRTLTVVAIILTTLVAVTATPAAADTPNRYSEAMLDLIVSTDAWHAELEAELVALSAKPQLACAESFDDLLRRGRWLSDDLRGSALSAPTPDLAASNTAAAKGFSAMLNGARHVAESCDGSNLTAGETMVNEGYDRYMSGSVLLRNFLGIAFEAPGGKSGEPAPALPDPAFPDPAFPDLG